ncbi:hypothetical protein AC578_8168 [Pseudocercospora eumusae]|uniref:Uncharacterized protein n=1 Tax=Pseudocercospora eumusae TaxID=321146 RepID=A0A139HAI0_9PEZI|nr:hypothetical protein AC578_8168 [Pseudocercospora eumusae]
MPCRRAVQAAQSQQCLWITDHVLNEAFQRFLRVSNAHHKRKSGGRRYGSNVPGPLEAHRRLSRRRMGMTASGAGIQPGGAEFGALFGFGGYGARVFDPAKDLKWKAPGREKEKMEEHWMFPKIPKRKNVFEHILNEAKPSIDPVDESKKAFESLLDSKQHVKEIRQDDLRDVLEFLQSSKDEPKAQNMKRMGQWLLSKTLENVAIRPLTDVVLDKMRLGTMDDKELPEVLAAMLMSEYHESPALQVLNALSREALQLICARTTQILFEHTFAGLVRVKELPVQIEKWLFDLRKCRHLRVGQIDDPIWQSVYEVLASRTSSPAAATSHLYRIHGLKLCLVLLKFWAPNFASTGEEQNMQSTTIRRTLSDTRATTDPSSLLATFNERWATTRRGSSPFVLMLSVLQDHGIPHGEFVHHLFTILTAKPNSNRHQDLVVYDTFRQLQQHCTLGVPAGLDDKLMRHFLSRDSVRARSWALRIFRHAPSLPATAYFSLPLRLARAGTSSSSTIWDILGRQSTEDVVWRREDRIGHGRNRLSQAHIDLVHLVAHECAKSLRPKVAFRRVWECYRFLRDRGAPITPLLTRAMVTAGVLRPLEDCKRPATTQVRYILSLVKEIEGEEVAMKLDQAVWTLWQIKTLPAIRLQRQFRAAIHSALPSADAHEQKLSLMYRRQRWSKAHQERRWVQRSSQSEDACETESVKFTPVQSVAESGSANVSTTTPTKPEQRMPSACELVSKEAEAVTDVDRPAAIADSVPAGAGTNSWNIKQSIISRQHDQSHVPYAPISVSRNGLGYAAHEMPSPDTMPVRRPECFSRVIKKAQSDDRPPDECGAQASIIATVNVVESPASVSNEHQECSSTSFEDAIDAHESPPSTTSEEPVLFRKVVRTYGDNGAEEPAGMQRARQGVSPDAQRNSAFKVSPPQMSVPIPREQLMKMAREADGVVVSPTGRVFVLWSDDNGAERLMHYQSARKRIYAEKARAEASKRHLSEHQKQLLALVDRGREELERVMDRRDQGAGVDKGVASNEGDFAWLHFEQWLAEKEAKEDDEERPSRGRRKKAPSLDPQATGSTAAPLFPIPIRAAKHDAQQSGQVMGMSSDQKPVMTFQIPLRPAREAVLQSSDEQIAPTTDQTTSEGSIPFSFDIRRLLFKWLRIGKLVLQARASDILGSQGDSGDNAIETDEDDDDIYGPNGATYSAYGPDPEKDG